MSLESIILYLFSDSFLLKIAGLSFEYFKTMLSPNSKKTSCLNIPSPPSIYNISLKYRLLSFT